MREELLQILIFLRETSSWDLAEDLAKGVYINGIQKIRTLDSIIGFINIAIKNSNIDERTNNLIKARDEMLKMKDKELQEKNEEKIELENLINF